MSIQITLNYGTIEEAVSALSRFGGNIQTAAAMVVASPAATPSEPALLVSASVSKYAEDNGVVLSREVTGTGKDGRVVKADVIAIVQARIAKQPPTPEEDDPFKIDDDPAPVVVTKEDVRDALVSYQTSLRDNLIDEGADEADAKRDAMVTARNLLEKLSGASTLGGLDESNYAKVVNAAAAAKAKL